MTCEFLFSFFSMIFSIFFIFFVLIFDKQSSTNKKEDVLKDYKQVVSKLRVFNYFFYLNLYIFFSFLLFFSLFSFLFSLFSFSFFLSFWFILIILNKKLITKMN